MANVQGSILVNDVKLNDTASTIRSSISKMSDLLEQATKKINDTNAIWTGGAGDTLRLKFDKFKATFDPFCQSVEQLAKFLDKSAEEYRISEANIKRAAEESISDVNV